MPGFFLGPAALAISGKNQQHPTTNQAHRTFSTLPKSLLVIKTLSERAIASSTSLVGLVESTIPHTINPSNAVMTRFSTRYAVCIVASSANSTLTDRRLLLSFFDDPLEGRKNQLLCYSNIPSGRPADRGPSFFSLNALATPPLICSVDRICWAYNPDRHNTPVGLQIPVFCCNLIPILEAMDIVTCPATCIRCAERLA